MSRTTLCAVLIAALLSAPASAQLLDTSANPAKALTMVGSGFRGSGYDKLITRQPKIAIPGFRVAFVVRTSASASERAGYMGGGEHTSGVSVKVEATLAGVDVSAMQRITDQAYADFVAMVKEAGREVVPMEETVASPGYKTLELAKATSEKPFFKSSGGRDYLVLAPTGLSLWFMHGDPLGDKGPFAIGNAKALSVISVDLKALTISPSMVVDFAGTKSSGRGGVFGGGEARAEVNPGMRLAGANMTLNYAREIKMGMGVDQDGGSATLEKPLTAEGDFGKLVKASESSNANVVKSFALLGLGIGPVRSKKELILEADGEKYAALASGVIRQAMNLFALSLRTGS